MIRNHPYRQRTSFLDRFLRVRNEPMKRYLLSESVREWRKEVLVLAALAMAVLPTFAGDKLEYNRDIGPILADNCFPCHGPDRKARKADLRLDRRDEAVSSGAIVAGNPDRSELIKRIFSSEEKERMPPPKSHNKLSTEQKETLRRWIAAGAEYQAHWAYIALRRSPVPRLQASAPVRNAIDAFVQQALEARTIKPAPETDRRTLLRRLSLDLIGLRQFVRGVSKAGRSPSAVAAFWRAHGPALARRCPLCRHGRLSR
jgi:hypothetical protein